jgi:hypothetical protein
MRVNGEGRTADGAKHESWLGAAGLWVNRFHRNTAGLLTVRRPPSAIHGAPRVHP